MASFGTMKFEALSRENYETWKIQMRALLVKNDLWGYVGGAKVKPEIIDGDEASVEACNKWTEMDEKAKADLILSISPGELKQIKNCDTSRCVWTKLEEIYQSKGPARKATLLKSLIQLKLSENKARGDIQDHLRKFFDIVDKLSEMEIKIDNDLLSIMLLYSLPSNFENFRCAMESRDELPAVDVLRIKITEEFEARRNGEESPAEQSSAYSVNHPKRGGASSWNNNKHRYSGNTSKTKPQKMHCDNKIKCYKCKKWGNHVAAQCPNNRPPSHQRHESVGLLTSADGNHAADALGAACNERRWCLDSGCTRHLSSDRNVFVNFEETDIDVVNLANNNTTEVKGCGKANIKANVNNVVQNVDIHDALFVPELRTNLLSVAKLCDRGYTVTFSKDLATIINSDTKVKLVADREDNLYYLRNNENNHAYHASESLDSSQNKFADLIKWHCRLGHINIKDLVESIKNGNIRGLNVCNIPKNFVCEICALNKLTRAPFPKKSSRVANLLEVVHSDLCGPIKVPSLGKSLYFMTFIDEYSRYCVVKFLKHKNEALDAFKEIKTLWENQKSVKIKVFMSDNGGEFINAEFEKFLKINGIKRNVTAPYCPEQSGIAERKNQTLISSSRCLLAQAKLNLNMWAEAVNCANYVRNRCPTEPLNGKTPYELFNNVVPNVSYFKTFGCTAYYLDNKPNHKFSPRSKKGIFVGYSENSKAFRIYNPEEKRFIVSRSVKFFEECDIKSCNNDLGELLICNEQKQNETNLEREIPFVEIEKQMAPNENSEVESFESDESNNSPSPLPEPHTLSLRNREVPRELPSSNHSTELVYNCNAEIPINSALSSEQSGSWYKALIEEMENILKNGTFELVERPTNKNCIGSRFVLTNKYSPDGSLLKNKARFVARGFSQKPGIDFGETFAPVARQGSIRIMAALAAKLNTEIHQFDITTAYLNGKLDEQIFMECPAYFKEILEQMKTNKSSNKDINLKVSKMLKSLNKGNKVLLLKKSLYGLKQAGRCWNIRLNQILNNFGAKSTTADPCVYYIKNGKGLTVITIYVDDILFMSEDPNMLEKFKNHLKRDLDLKYAGLVKYCLGINFKQENGMVAMSQQSYIRELLNRFDMAEANTVSCPMDPGIKLKRSDKCDMEGLPYRELVGGLLYLATSTRPDIANTVSKLSQFLNCFDNTHWKAAKRVLRYLKKTINFGLIFKRTDESLFGYTDSDWANSIDDRKSYTGFCFIFCGSSISWESRKQCTVALSSTEAEYMALSDGTKEAIYLRKLLNDLCDFNLKSVRLLCDNKGAIKLAENPIFHRRTKHIDIRHHFIRECVNNNVIEIQYVATENMAADIFTKALPSPRHYKCLKALGVHDVSFSDQLDHH